MGRCTKDIHYSLRASERGANVPCRVVLDCGHPVEKRPRHVKKNEKKIRAIKYFSHVHIFSPDLNESL